MDVLRNMFSGGNVLTMFFSFHGRLPRAVFWFRVGLLHIFVNLVGSVIPGMMEGTSSGDSMSLLITLYGGYWISLSTLWVRRMQDRDVHGAWYAVVGLLGPAALLFRIKAVEWMNAGNPMGQTMDMPSILFGMAVFIAACAILVMFGFSRGTPGENRFGPDPLRVSGGGKKCCM